MLRRPTALFLLLLGGLTAQAEPPDSPKIIERYKQMLEKSPAEGLALDRLWKIYSDQGQTAQLLAEYEKAPDFNHQMILGLLLRKAGQPEKALAAFAKAQQLEPANPAALLAQARVQTEENRPKLAAPLIEQALERLDQNDPRIPETLLALGSAWLGAADLPKASAAWERIIALEPNNLPLRQRLAETYLTNRLTEPALKHLQFLKSHRNGAERVQTLQQIARLHQGAGHQDQAIEAYEEALAGAGPTSYLRADLQSQLIRLHQRYHRTEELEQKWKKSVAENPRDLTGYLQLIDLYERLGNLEEQLVWVEKLCALAPKNRDYKLRQARLHLQLDQLDQAMALFELLLKEQPGQPDLIFACARIDMQRDAIPSARQRIQDLLAKNPSDELLHQRALDFFQSFHLHDLAEQQLKLAPKSEENLLALAQFYFAQRREVEARQVLQSLVDPSATLNVRAAAYLRIAQILKDQSDTAGAIAALDDALLLQPDSREFHFLLGELYNLREQPEAARSAFEKAFTLSRTPAETLEADQKLFETIRSPGPQNPGDPIPLAAKRPTGAAELADYLLKLTRTAAEEPSVENWLRIARWQFWNRSLRVAQECAQKALSLNPDSIEAHEFLVKLATSDSELPLALTHLEELIRLNPSGRTGYLRRMAQAELEANRAEDALRRYRELVRTNPGNLDALTDLGLALQRAERWKDALATWLQIESLTPPARKKEITSTLLRIYERLGMARDAANLLLRQIDAQADEKLRLTLLQELLTHCAKHKLLDWLRTQFEERHQLRADDYFTEVALGRILKAQGEKGRAFDLLSEASFVAPNQAEALPDLIREAEDLRKFSAATRLQAQLVRIVPQTSPEALEKLALLQERNFELEEALRTWDKLVSRFSRDASILQHAVDFHLKWGKPDRALELLRRLRSLEPKNLSALSALAELELEAGNLEPAQDCLQSLLGASTPEKPGSPIRLPGRPQAQPGRVQNSYLNAVRLRGGRPSTETLRALRSFWVDPAIGTTTESDLRLNAIRDLARLNQLQPKALEAWIGRWRQAFLQSPNEALWALFFSGASAPLLDELEKWMTQEGVQTQGEQAFIWFCLQSADYPRLARWLHDPARSIAQRDSLFVALGEHLQATGGRLEPALVNELFAGNFRLWQGAMTLAGSGHLHEATQLGQRLFDQLSSHRPSYGLELAHWYIFLGDLQNARRLLSLSSEEPADNFDSPVYEAIRENYLLRPLADRPAFLKQSLEKLGTQNSPIHQAIGSCLLYGLSGEEEAARGQLRRLLEMRAMANLGDSEPGNSVTRFWSFVLNAGAQLQQWHLESLALFLWDSALADPALLQLQIQNSGDQVRARLFEIRARRAAIKISRATPPEIDAIVTEHARFNGGDALVPLAELLEARGSQAAAISIYRQLWESEPTNPHALRNLISGCKAGKDSTTLDLVLKRCLQDGIFRSNDAAHRDLLLQLVDLLEERKEFPQTQAILEEAIKGTPRESRLLNRLAQMYERQGRLDLAEATYRKLLSFEAANGVARLALAAVLQKAGHLGPAIEVLEKNGHPESDARLVELYGLQGQIEEAIIALERLPTPNQLTPGLGLASLLSDKGDFKTARIILRQIVLKQPESQTSFPLQAKFLEMLAPNEDRGLLKREWRRLRRMAGSDQELLDSYFTLADRLAPKLHWEQELESELIEEWEDGEGTLAAGAALLDRQLGKDPNANVDALFAKILGREDATETLLQKMLSRFQSAGRKEAASKTQERMTRINPLNPAPMFAWAKSLHQSGETERAFSVLAVLSSQAVLNDQINGQVAQTLVELNADPAAQPFFEQAILADPAGKQYGIYLDYARWLNRQGQFGPAVKILRLAFRHPANRAYDQIITLFAAAGKLPSIEPQLPEFWFTPAQLNELRWARVTYHAGQNDPSAALALVEKFPDLVTASRHPKLALILLQAAEQALKIGPATATLNQLKRALELQPAHPAIVQRAAELLVQAGQKAFAIQALENFLALIPDGPDKTAARKLLAELKSG